ncbi:MAG: GGDEF domain-containing protein [Treponema sp.]|nr:GGDEF domain-containing protein [Treponema sp.]
MRNIVVFVHSFSVEFADLIINGIFKYYKDRKDSRVYFVQTFNPHNDEADFDYQYWASYEYLKSQTIDEVILVSNTYSYYMSSEEIRETAEPYFSKKFISIGFELDPQRSYYVVSGCEDSYQEVVSHLKNVHGCSKIGFVSANKLKNQEALSRYEAFKKALKNNGLEFHPEWVTDGDFTDNGIKETLAETYKTKEDVPFEAIICANDVMGIAVLNYMTSIGIKIPEELKIFGLDNTYHSILCTPNMATIDQDIEGIGFKAAEFGMKLLDNDKDMPRHLITPMKVVYRHSCGCKDTVEQKKREVFNGVFNRYKEFNQLKNLFDLIQGTSTIHDFAQSFTSVVKYSGFKTMDVYVLPEPKIFDKMDDINLNYEDKFVRPLLKIDTENDIAEYYEESEGFYTADTLFPKDKFAETPGSFIFQPLFMNKFHYGYLICKVTYTDFTLNSLLLKIITSLVIQAYAYTKTVSENKYLETLNQQLEEKTKELDISAKTDELTGLLNRRGFMEYGQRLVNFSSEMKSNGLVFFADLDGLKKINDNYGHEYGDKAIKAEADILRHSFRKMDVIGRLSGDEFGIVASGLDISKLENIREKVDQLNEKYSKKYQLPFKLSISLGATQYNMENKDLSVLLKTADKNLYEQKEIHHARQAKEALGKYFL